MYNIIITSYTNYDWGDTEMKLKKITYETIVSKAANLFTFFMIAASVILFFIFNHLKTNILTIFIGLNIFVCLFCFYFIKKKMFYEWTGALYGVCLDMMTAGTICMGFGYGFAMYSIPIIAVSFYIYYIAKKAKIRPINPNMLSCLSIGTFFISITQSYINGPIYTINEQVQMRFLLFNSISVFTILIIFIKLFMLAIKNNETQLSELALKDKLTGLYNRHYLLSYIESIDNQKLADYWLAMLDIDDFKKINDQYGHDCGDQVLKQIADIINKFCCNCTVCRWGGEEFIILGSKDNSDIKILSELKNRIAQNKIQYDNNMLNITATIGAQNYKKFDNVDIWISEADKKLYRGKNNGKNVVVY